MTTITIQQIENTEAFKKLDKGVKPIYLKKQNREEIEHAFIVFKNNGYINPKLNYKNAEILKELIQLDNEKKNTTI